MWLAVAVRGMDVVGRGMCMCMCMSMVSRKWMGRSVCSPPLHCSSGGEVSWRLHLNLTATDAAVEKVE